MTIVEFIEDLVLGERSWEVWMWEMPIGEEQRRSGPYYYDVVSRHHSQIAAIRSKDSQPPAPFNHWYRVVDRRRERSEDVWVKRS